MSGVNLVKGCPLFHEIYDNEISEIIKHCVVASYEPDDLIIKQGDTSTDIYVLLYGHADIYVNVGDSKKFITTLTTGDLFGELVLINETQRTANIVSRDHCDVLIISYDDFYSFYHKSPNVFALMVLNVTRLITKRLKNANTVIQDLSSKLQHVQENNKE
jgi:CRP/FNR family cyclic AMP-dependent transcriptional regulator